MFNWFKKNSEDDDKVFEREILPQQIENIIWLVDEAKPWMDKIAKKIYPLYMIRKNVVESILEERAKVEREKRFREAKKELSENNEANKRYEAKIKCLDYYYG